jgi:hypothetical protein
MLLLDAHEVRRALAEPDTPGEGSADTLDVGALCPCRRGDENRQRERDQK